MTVTSGQRNRGNVELINSRTELLVRNAQLPLCACDAHAEPLEICLWCFELHKPFGIRCPPAPSHHCKSQTCVCMCSCVCLLTFSLSSPERGDTGRAKSIPTLSLEISDLPCLFHFSPFLSNTSSEKFSFFFSAGCLFSFVFMSYVVCRNWSVPSCFLRSLELFKCYL